MIRPIRLPIMIGLLFGTILGIAHCQENGSKASVSPILFSAPCLIVDLTTGNVSEHPKIPADLLTKDAYRTKQMVLSRIPAGTFMMGSPRTEIGRGNDEEQRQVTISHPFYMAVFPCTQAQYEQIVGKNPSKEIGDRHPVERVSWGNARGGEWPSGEPAEESFIGRLRKRTGLNVDLPTEAEWEYACRAGTIKAYNNDTDILTQEDEKDTNLDPLAWYRHNVPDKRHQEVGLKLPNSWGLYDMHGNIREWCLDVYDPERDTHSATDPAGPVPTLNRSYRVLRGGCWFNRARDCRSAARSFQSPGHSYTDFGFRVVVREKN